MNVTIRLTVPEAVVLELRGHAAANGHELHDELAVMVREHLKWRRGVVALDNLMVLRREVRKAHAARVAKPRKRRAA